MSKQSDLVNIAQGDTITVDHANGRVGIGTSSPVVDLHVSSSSSTKATFERTGATGAFIGLKDSSGSFVYMGGNSGVFVVQTPGSSYSTKLAITSAGNVGIGTINPATTLDVSDVSRYTFNVSNAYTLQTSINAAGSAFADDYKNAAQHIWQSSGAESMRINSAGNVTKPNQPMFLGYPTNDYSGGSMPTGVMSVTALYNNGGHFNAANSRFTAPVAGWYLTTWGGLQSSATVTSLMINGTRTHNGNHGVFTGSYVTMTQTVIRYLNAGDYFNIEQWNGGGYYNSWYAWSVTLLG